MSIVRKYLFIFLSLLLCFIQIVRAQDNSTYNSKNVYFNEIWAYLMYGEEKIFDTKYPITDIGYFAVSLNDFGELLGVPDRSKLIGFNGRVHLVIALVFGGDKAKTHFALDPKFPIRKKLIKDIH